jgi:WD40 repeat protein/serine/threonine protein kinase
MMSDGFPNLSDPGPAGLETCPTNSPESRVDVPTSGDLTAELVAYQEALACGDAPGADSRQVTGPGLVPELRDARSCLRLLDRVWREPVADSGELSPHTPRSLGRFQIERKLGQGGFGIVFLAHDPELGRKVALKVPHTAGLLSPELRRRFLNEARAAARLEHPYIVPVYEAGEIGALCYIVTAYCEGPTLADWLKEQTGPVPERTAAALVACLAEAIAYTHRQGILHRDLKPANILLVSGGAVSGEWSKQEAQASLPTTHHSLLTTYQPKITDFGLAKLLEGEGCDTTGTGTLLGTAPYMAPEQALGRSGDIGPSADVYALGVILYELLAGRPPFQGETPLETLDQVRTQEPVPPRRLRPKLSCDLETICLTCLHKAPHQRYAGADALGADLKRYFEGKPIHARPASVVERTTKWVRRRPTAAALLGTLLLGVIAFLGMTIAYLSELRSKNEDLRSSQIEVEKHLAESLAQGARLREQYYGVQTRSVVELWRQDALEPMAEILNGLKPGPDEEDLRGFEWQYLWRLGRSRQYLRGHQDVLLSVAWSPDGRLVATGGMDGGICLWDRETATLRTSLTGHRMPVTSLALSPDGMRLVSTGCDQGRPPELKVWDVVAGREVADFASSLASADLRQFCAASIHDTRSMRIMALSRDGRLVAANDEDESKRSLRVFDLNSGRLVRSLCNDAMQWRTVTALEFSPDGRTVAIGFHGDVSSTGAGVSLLDLATGREAAILEHPPTTIVRALAFSMDGKILFTKVSKGTLTRWNLATRQPKVLFDSSERVVYGGVLAVSPDGATVVCASSDKESTVRLIDARDGTLRRAPVRCNFGIGALTFTPDGRSLALACSDRFCRVWAVTLVAESRTLPRTGQEAWALAFSPDNQILAVGYDDQAGHDRQTLLLWDILEGRSRATLTGQALVTSAAFSPDGSLLASGSYDKTVRLWRQPAGTLLKEWDARTGKIRTLAFSPNGQMLAIAGKDGLVRAWDLSTSQEQFALKSGDMRCLAFSPNSKILATAGLDNAVKVWTAARGDLLYHLENGRDVFGLAFSPDGKILATGDREGAVRFWDLATQKALTREVKHRAEVRSVAYSPDGKTLASGSADRSVRLWQTATGLELLAFKDLSAEVNAVAFSPDGRTLAAALHDGTVRLWETAPDTAAHERRPEARRKSSD